MTFHEFIRQKGYTVKSLAEAAGVSPRSLEQYSTGRYPWSNARLWFAAAVAKALEIPVEKLLEFDD